MLQSERFQENSGMQVENEEQFANVLDLLLPEIERQLIKDIEQQLAAQFEEKYQKAIEEINNQAYQQYEQAIQQLQESRHILQTEKESQIQNQIQSLEFTHLRLEEQLMEKFQEKFLEEHFDSKIMTHYRIQELQKQTEEQIYEALEEKHEATKQRQIKELIIAHQTKQIKLRKQLDQQIKSRIYCSSGLEELKLQIKQSKTQMGSQKSEYNLRLKKIETEIKEYQDKIKEYEKMPHLQKLREKYEELKLDLIERDTERELENDEKKRQNTNNDSDQEKYENKRHQIRQDSFDENDDQQQNFSNKFSNQNPNQPTHQRSNSKTLKRQPRNQLLNEGMKFTNRPQQIVDEQYSESQSQPQITQNQKSNSLKFNLTAYFKGQLLNSQTAQITQSQNIYVQQNPIQKKSLLNLQNVSDLLKQKIRMDPLEKYLNGQSVSKQNDMNAQNINNQGQKTSNFAQLYEQHLKNLNKGFAKNIAKTSQKNGTQGLSQMAKKAIIKNLSSYHRNNFCNPLEQNNQKQKNTTNIVHEPFKTYQSNLLASYK